MDLRIKLTLRFIGHNRRERNPFFFVMTNFVRLNRRVEIRFIGLLDPILTFSLRVHTFQLPQLGFRWIHGVK